MVVRTEKYPLDVSTRFPESTLTSLPLVRAHDRISGLTVNPDTDDLTTEIVYRMARLTYTNVPRVLAYCDVIDLAQETQGLALEALNTRLATLEQRAASLGDQVASIKSTVEQLLAFMGVIIPAWATKKEVENGDDMGVSRLSAEALGLKIEFAFDRQVPGFQHEDVVTIEPPAGTLVVRGSTVTVTLNLEG